MQQPQLNWFIRILITLGVSSILFLMIWVFSQFREPPGFNILMSTLLVLMAFVCMESIRLTQQRVSKWGVGNIPYVKDILAFVVPVLMGTLVYCILFYFFKWLDYYLLGSEPPLIPHMVSALLIGLILSLIFGLIFWVVTWKDSYYRAIIKTEAYKNEMVNANLITLRNQMNPHFLFNNFNTIYYLIDQNPSVAKKFLKNISNIYRHILNHSNENLIEAMEEYKVMLQHIEILKERFGQSLKLKNEVKENHLKEKHLPPLVLHELLENVMKHNRIDDENHIVLKLISAPDSLVLSNNRIPKKVMHSTKTGLDNIIARYNLLTQSKVLVEKHADYFQVRIPLIALDNES